MMRKTRVDVLDLLSYYNIEIILRGEEASFSCPFHNDRDPSASINIFTGNWTCYREKIGGTPIDFVSWLEHWEYKKADLWLRNRYGGFYKPASLLKEINRTLNIQEFQIYPNSVLERFSSKTAYWKKRGLSKESIIKYELGYDAKTKRVTIPIRDHDGRLVGVQGRAIDTVGEKEHGKYLFLYDLPKRQYLYGLHLIDSSSYVVVVEGVVPTIRLMEMGIPCVSTLGSVVSVNQAYLLNGFEKVYMLYDNDEAGWDGMIGPPNKPNSQLAAWKKIKTKVYIPTNEDYSDIDGLDKDSILDIIKTSKNAHVNIPIANSKALSHG